MTTETCQTCKHWQRTPGFESGLCRRHAPVVAMDHYPDQGGGALPNNFWDTAFPNTNETATCGDHAPAEQPERWASVEIMGHQRLAGRLSVDYSTGHALTRVDVPEVTVSRMRRDYDENLSCYLPVHREIYTIPSWFKLLGKGAIYAIQDIDQADALAAARNIQATPAGWEPTDVRSEPINVDPTGDASDDQDVPRCRVCGCTDERPCPGGCSWVEDPEGGERWQLCSACADTGVER